MAAAALRQTAAARGGADPARGVPAQADSITLSDSARALANANKSVGSAAGVREARVAALKAAVANGTYAVDSRVLAESMVRYALQ
jgi:negative regulator of flagellin synthesis FlgM